MNKNLLSFVFAVAVLCGVRAERIELKPFPELSAPRAVTAGPHCRCDLHPQWRPDGKQIGFNSVHEGSRQVYVMDEKGE